jgi:hypothetical protein
VRLFALAVVAPFAACGGSDDSDGVELDPATAKLVYQFHDSSVPPEFHRSYTLTADATEANLVVDSYGDVLHDVTEPMDDQVWGRAVAAAAGMTDPSDATSEGGCAGGTSEELHVSNEQEDVVDVFVDHCGSSDGTDLTPVVGEMLGLFDLDALLATG